MVAVSDLVVRRGPVRAVDSLSFETAAGEVTGLLGPSGCGKSTLMRALVGVQKVAGGTVTVLGEPAGSRPLRDRIGYVTQAPSVYDDLSVTENLRFFARVLDADAEAVGRAIDVVDLDSHRDAVVRDLWDLFHRLADDGAVVIVSSHVMDEAERCDRLLLMRDGVLLADGTPAEIKESAGAGDVEQAFLAIVRGTAA